jgi:hypothetical protein
MDDIDREAALRSAMTTEHFVLQGAASATTADAASRSSLYMLALSSSLVAIGFTSRSPEIFLPFVAAVLPVNFIVGLITSIRLMDITLENLQYLSNIARIRAYYRTISPAAEKYFSARTGRWPEAEAYTPSGRLGPLMASLGTTGTMIALVNNVVGAAGIALLTQHLAGESRTVLALGAGAATFIVLTIASVAFQNWRLREIEQGHLPED